MERLDEYSAVYKQQKEKVQKVSSKLRVWNTQKLLSNGLEMLRELKTQLMTPPQA